VFEKHRIQDQSELSKLAAKYLNEWNSFKLQA
jgi:hypothetical protein